MRNRRFCIIAFFPAMFVLSNSKHAPSLELPLTACKTVFSHLKYYCISVYRYNSFKLLQLLHCFETFICFSLCFSHSLFGRCDSDRLFSEGFPWKLGRIPTAPLGFLYPKIIIRRNDTEILASSTWWNSHDPSGKNVVLEEYSTCTFTLIIQCRT